MEAIITAAIPWIETPEFMTLVFFMHGIPSGVRSPGMYHGLECVNPHYNMF